MALNTFVLLILKHMNNLAQNYLNFSDEVLENLIDLQNKAELDDSYLETSKLTIVDNVIDEYCTLLKEISKEEGPEYVELGNIVLNILKTSMHLKMLMEKNSRRHMYVA